MLKSAVLIQKTSPVKIKHLGSIYVACIKCNKITKGILFEKENKVFLKKECCGEIKYIEGDAKIFKSLYLKYKFVPEFGKKVKTIDELIDYVYKNSSRIALYLSDKCNLTRPICLLKYEKPVFREPDMKEIVSLLKRVNALKIDLAGREPTLREDLPEILKVMRRNGKFVHLLTNGLRLIDLSYVHMLKKAGGPWWEVVLQFDGFDNKVYERLRGAPLLMTRFVILQNLKKEKIRTVLAAVIGKNINEHYIPSIIKLACKHNDFIKEVLLVGLYTRGSDLEHTMTATELHRAFCEQTGINLEYLIEWRRLRYNCYVLFRRIFKKTYIAELLSDDMYMFEVKNGNIVPCFTCKELNTINKWLEEISKEKNTIKLGIKLFFGFKRLMKPINILLLPFFARIVLHSEKLWNFFWRNKLKVFINSQRPWFEIIEYLGIPCVPIIFSSNRPEPQPALIACI